MDDDAEGVREKDAAREGEKNVAAEQVHEQRADDRHAVPRQKNQRSCQPPVADPGVLRVAPHFDAGHKSRSKALKASQTVPRGGSAIRPATAPGQPLRDPSHTPPYPHRRFNFNLRCASGGVSEGYWRDAGVAPVRHREGGYREVPRTEGLANLNLARVGMGSGQCCLLLRSGIGPNDRYSSYDIKWLQLKCLNPVHV